VLYDLYCLPDIVGVSEARRITWVGHVAHMERGEMCIGVLVGNLKEEITPQIPRH
jgi:hypothetical protein